MNGPNRSFGDNTAFIYYLHILLYHINLVKILHHYGFYIHIQLQVYYNYDSKVIVFSIRSPIGVQS